MPNPAQQRPNDPCNCESGKKYKKCCFSRHVEEATARNTLPPPPPKEKVHYRFKRGDYVLAYHNKAYQPGQIVALNYWEPGWTQRCPYQIQIKDGIYDGLLIYAPTDEDRYVKKLPDDPDDDWAMDLRMTMGKRRLRDSAGGRR